MNDSLHRSVFSGEYLGPVDSMRSAVSIIDIMKSKTELPDVYKFTFVSFGLLYFDFYLFYF